MIKFFSVLKYGLTKLRLDLTKRGWFILLFLIILVFGPIKYAEDITATIIAITLTFIQISLAIFTACYAKFLQNNLLLSIEKYRSDFNEYNQTDNRIYSGKKTPLTIKIPTCRIFPFYGLKITWNFKNESPKNFAMLLKGRFPISQNLVNEISFPHRGIWEIENLSLELEDLFGLTNITWNIDNEQIKQNYTVYPEIVSASHFPILSSFYKTGDLITSSKEHLGEPLDLKRYHPSDGIKKISWKIFARSRVLMSRHQEAASSPEGEVALFCLARKTDDHAAAASLSYLRHLLDSDLEIIFGCLGQDQRIAHDLETAEAMLLEDVWKIKEDDINGNVLSFISNIKAEQTNLNLQTLLFILDYKLLAEETVFNTLTKLASELSSQQIEAIFLFTGEKPELNKNQEDTRSVPKKILEKLFLPPQPKHIYDSYYPQFMNTALKNRWQVYGEEEYL